MPKKIRPRSSSRTVTGFTKALADTTKYRTELLGDVQKYVLKRLDDARRDDILHPSEMAKPNWCPRASVYRMSGYEPTNDDPIVENLRLLTIFAEGNDFHDKWQMWLWEMGRLWGMWRCLACNHKFWALAPKECEGCGVPGALRYAEVPMSAESDLPIAGQADGAVPDINSLIEVKSIGTGTVRMEDPDLLRKYTHRAADSGKQMVDLEGLWKGIRRPLKSHRIQGGIYLWLAKQKGLPYDKMLFIYENKANQGTKEFVITYNEDGLADILDIAADVKYAVDNDRLLPRPVGFTKDKKPCKECVFKDLCWGAESEPEESTSQPRSRAGRSIERRSKEVGRAADTAAEAAHVRVSRASRGSDSPGRQRTDGTVQPDAEVGGVPGSATGHVRGRRTVSRRRTQAR